MNIEISHVHLELEVRNLEVNVEVSALSPVVVVEIACAKQASILISAGNLVFTGERRSRLDEL